MESTDQFSRHVALDGLKAALAGASPIIGDAKWRPDEGPASDVIK